MNQITQTLPFRLIVLLVASVTLAMPFMAQAAALEIDPTYVGITTNNVVSVPGDGAPGFADASFASNGIAKTDIYFDPVQLFGRAVTLGEIDSFSYWTKKDSDHVTVPADWYLTLYTAPYAGDISSATWYGDRIGTEPYFSENLNDPANTWNLWSTDGAQNTLRFFESTAGAPGANFGSYTDPSWDTLMAGNALSGQPYATRDLLYFTVQTGSAWAAGFEGQVDGLTITLTDGTVATVNFEDVPPPPPVDPTVKADCFDGGWEAFGFANQGQCVRFVETGKDSR